MGQWQRLKLGEGQMTTFGLSWKDAQVKNERRRKINDSSRL